MSKIIRRIWNLIAYFKWTACTHKECSPIDFADWKCDSCGVES